MLVPDVLERLAQVRPVFHSEADMQHAFAWTLREGRPQLDIRLEVPVEVEGRRIYVDLMVRDQDRWTAFEFKYLTAALDVERSGERFELRDQAAQDIQRYDVIKDIRRLEMLASQHGFDGHAVVLTNDPSYWAPPTRPTTIDKDFRLTQDRVVEGELAWAPHAGAGTTKSRDRALRLTGKYPINWHPYSLISEQRRGEFRSLHTHVIAPR